MPRMFHVSSTRNRASIARYGLDWTRMAAAPGIAGSPVPELDGVFLSHDESTTDFFVSMNNTGGTVDVWAVDGVDAAALERSTEGYDYLPAPIPPEALTLLRHDLAVPQRQADQEAAEAGEAGEARDSGAYSSTLTITWDDDTDDTD